MAKTKKPKGRPDKYDILVKPHLKRIPDMALQMSQEQIAKTLGVAYSTFRKYRDSHKELKDALERGISELVFDAKSTLIRKAKGYTYEEKKIIKLLKDAL